MVIVRLHVNDNDYSSNIISWAIMFCCTIVREWRLEK